MRSCLSISVQRDALFADHAHEIPSTVESERQGLDPCERCAAYATPGELSERDER